MLHYSSLLPNIMALRTSCNLIIHRSISCRLCNRKQDLSNLFKVSDISRNSRAQHLLRQHSFVPYDYGTRQNVCTDSASGLPLNSGGRDCGVTDTLGGSCAASSTLDQQVKVKVKLQRSGPTLHDFIADSYRQNTEVEVPVRHESIPYLSDNVGEGKSRRVYFETYGCQMNVSDTEIAWAILERSGFQKVEDISNADVILAVTCAIRENAEQKIWNRLKYFQSLKNNRRKGETPLKIGVLGCMAERLKKKLLEQSKTVDIVAGPDAYRDLPRLLTVARSGQAAINVMLSMDETYADVIPVRLDTNSKSAFVSIMRGCDNMCSYCIVPFTRGRERSRPISSIIDEIQALSDQGVKEVTLLGQNVNSYRDVSEENYYNNADLEGTTTSEPTRLARGFKSIYKPKKGGRRFADLLEKVAMVDPEMRIRFTSPHPKDFPDEVLHAIRDFPNICNQLHLPAQSGSTKVLHSMRRGYSRESYLELVDHVRSVIPGVALSSDFIAGFCRETEEDHKDTMSLLHLVKYNYAFLFAYSMRQKTHAYHKMEDDVPEEVKQRRLTEMITVCRDGMSDINAMQVGAKQLVLIEGTSKRSERDLVGRNDANTKVVFPNIPIPSCNGYHHGNNQSMKSGDYIAVEITEANSQVLKGTPLYHTTLVDFSSRDRNQQRIN
ncbi:mitochondrial tRNA methylthiotransferase CDK5RAP1-like [Lytechinus variegatus]|uniref:mitochondrial tRNA methylthiotransferase CDK5RAP1-like n=1 Tax=Lytechinus variegatus TaxID=7654 RepID=UPI001BB13A7A|nr:mitochondrial tRNA methylthiotransferase CDK5RAP1-like [Lytechinus variegatus]